MERFWDARAREDPYYFVDSRLEYGAPDEDAFWAGGLEALDRLLGAVGAAIEPGSAVVDVGCGLGRLTRPLAERAGRVIAIDVSREMLDRAMALNGDLDNVEWVHGDGTTLRPLADGSVDACLSHVVFRHVPDPAITLGYVREIGRVLRPGGFAAIEVSNDPRPHAPGRSTLRRRAAALLGRAPRGGEHAAWLGSHVDLGDLRRAAAEAALDVERVAGEGTEFCAVLLRRREGAIAGGYYDRYWSAPRTPRYEPEPELRALLLERSAGARVLDVGCGAANGYAPQVAARAASYVGVDVSERAVALARRAGLDARVVDDAAQLPFADGSFDAALCVEVLEHLFAPADAVAEIRRVLRPGGTLVASTPNAAYWRLRADLLRGVWNPHGDERAIDEPWRDPHIRFFTPASLERMLRRAGFRTVAVGAHGGRFLDHLTSRPTAFGQSRLYRAAARRRPALLGATIHAVAER
jgi:SAM-dependent methyltransferase